MLLHFGTELHKIVQDATGQWDVGGGVWEGQSGSMSLVNSV